MKDSAQKEKQEGPHWPAKGLNSIPSMKKHHGGQYLDET